MKKIIFLLIIVAVLIFIGKAKSPPKPAEEHWPEQTQQSEISPVIVAAGDDKILRLDPKQL